MKYYSDLLPGDLIISDANTAMFIVSSTPDDENEPGFRHYIWLPLWGHARRDFIGHWSFHYKAMMLPHDRIYRDGAEI